MPNLQQTSNPIKPAAWQESGWRYAWVIFVVIILDQLTKVIALHYLQPYQPVAVMPLLNMTLAFNPGAAFSFLGDQDGWQRWFFIGLAFAVSAALAIWLRRIRYVAQPKLAWALLLIVGGALGNVIDRIVHHHVVDFIDVYWGAWHYPTFNIADIAITFGALLLIWDAWTEKQQTKDNQS